MENSAQINQKEIRKKILSMILPITFESLLQTSTVLVTMAIIGRISETAVASVGLSSRFSQIVFVIFKGISTGAAIFVAQAYGSNDIKKAKSVIKNTLVSSVVFVIIIQILMFLFANNMINGIFHPEADILLGGTQYLKILSFGFPFWIIIVVNGSILQAIGNARTPMYIAAVMNVLNIIFSVLFINIFKFGVKGAAMATLCSQIICAFLALYVIFNKNGLITLKFNKELLSVDRNEVKDIYKVGIPSSIESILWQIAAIILTNVMLGFGKTSYAAYQLALQAEAISYMPAQGFGVAATAFIGQSLGLRNEKLGRAYFKEILRGTALVTGVSSALLLIFPKAIMAVLTNNTQLINLGAIYLILMGLVQFPQNISWAFNGALRGAGYTKVPMIVSFIGIWGIRVPFSLILTKVYHMNIVAIWTVMCVDLIVRFFVSFGIYKSKEIYNQKLIYEK